MRIQKLLHSCLLVEEGHTRILFDPGNWSFGPGLLDAIQLPKIDAIFITHKHPDHCDPTTIKTLVTRDSCPVYANTNAGYYLHEAGVTAKELGTSQTAHVGSCTVVSIPAPHGLLPWSDAINNGYVVNNRLLVPGDSYAFEGTGEILALPIISPWGTSTDAIHVALKVKPKHVIPVHDMIVADRFRERLIDNVGKTLEAAGISYHPLKPGEALEI